MSTYGAYCPFPRESLRSPIYMDAALKHLRKEGYLVRDEDMARQSPLSYGHISMLGRYAFSVPEAVARGELQPLRNPADNMDS